MDAQLLENIHWFVKDLDNNLDACLLENDSIIEFTYEGIVIYKKPVTEFIIPEEGKLYEWVKSNTSLQEVEPRKFLISEEQEFMGQVYPSKYLVIE